MEKRYIGIDLHRNQFTCCMQLENGRTYPTKWRLEDLGRFVKKLRASDEVAVEITGNTRLFHDAVAPHVARVVVVDTNQFRVISRSVKATPVHAQAQILAPKMLEAGAFRLVNDARHVAGTIAINATGSGVITVFDAEGKVVFTSENKPIIKPASEH